MATTFVFSTDFHVTAEDEEQARKSFLQLLMLELPTHGTRFFDVVEEIDEEQDQ